MYALLAVLLLASFWFLGVHRVEVMEHCPSCHYGLWTEQCRVLGITVKNRVLDPGTGNFMFKISRDLGVPCQHTRLDKFTKIRWWGLLLKWPNWNGNWVEGGISPWYDAWGPEVVRRMVELDPELPETFRRRAIQDIDDEYRSWFFGEFWRMMEEAREEHGDGSWPGAPAWGRRPDDDL